MKIKVPVFSGISRMSNYEFSDHAYRMLTERNIQEQWVTMTLENPEIKERKQDGTDHYIKMIEESGSRFLRVIVNSLVNPQRIVTVFFDRRLRRQG